MRPVATGRATIVPDWLPGGPESNLRVTVRDAQTAGRLPAKLTLLGRAGTPNPKFAIGASRIHEWGVTAYHRAFIGLEDARLAVPPGRYDIWVSRGLEYTRAVARDVLVEEGESLLLEASLRRVINEPGWVSADLHVHTANSADSVVPLASRVHQFAAEGVDVLVATDHNHITSLGDVVQARGLGDDLSTVAGQELTTYLFGHFGVFPLVPNAQQRNAGALRGGEPHAMFADIKRRAPTAAVVVNHPWSGRHGYFSRGKLEPQQLVFGRRGFVFGFDAIELLNGYELSSRARFEHHLHEWFALLRAGFVVTATGNSDSHKLALNQGGYPRNYVGTGGDRTGSAIAEAVVAGRSFLTTGPFVRVQVDGAEMGETVAAVPGEQLTVAIEVSAAPWVDVSEVTLWLGGEPYRTWAVPTGGTDSRGVRKTAPFSLKRLSVAISIDAMEDTFVVVTAQGDNSLWPVLGERSWDCRRFRFKRRACPRRHLDVRPVAVTNPILVDVDGNGRYDALAPPGLYPE